MREWFSTLVLPLELTVERIFKVGTRYARYQPNYNTEAANGFFNILDPKAVKPWRDAYQPYFSKAAISRLEPLVHDRIKKFLSVLESAAATNKPVDLSMGYRNLTSDVVTSYMFADKGFELVEVDDFRSPILEALEEYFNNAQWSLYWPNFMAWLTRQMQMLTKEQTQRLIPALAATNWITEVGSNVLRRLWGHLLILIAAMRHQSEENHAKSWIWRGISHCFRCLGESQCKKDIYSLREAADCRCIHVPRRGDRHHCPCPHGGNVALDQ